MKGKLALASVVAALAVPSGSQAVGVTPGCDVTTYGGAVCAVRGYIAVHQDLLGPPTQGVRCAFASRRVGTYTQHHGRLRPHSIVRDPRWSCRAVIAGRFVVIEMAPTGRPELWQVASLALTHGG